MTKILVTAVASSIGSFLIATFAGALFLAGAMNAAHVPSFSPAYSVWDQFLVTPLAFLVTGLVFGAIAAGGAALRTALYTAAGTALALAIILVVGTHAFMVQIQGTLREQGYSTTVGPIGGHDLNVVMGASLLWIAWFVAGAAIAFKVRTRQAKATQTEVESP